MWLQVKAVLWSSLEDFIDLCKANLNKLLYFMFLLFTVMNFICDLLRCCALFHRATNPQMKVHLSTKQSR